MHKIRSLHTWWLTPTVVIVALGLVAQIDVVEARTISEIFSVGIYFMVFSFAWILQKHSRDASIVFLGLGYFAVGLSELLHVSADISSVKEVYFWISSRFLESLVLLGALLIKATTEVSRAKAMLAATVVVGVFPAQFFIQSELLMQLVFTLEFATVLMLGLVLGLAINSEKAPQFRVPIAITAGINLTLTLVHMLVPEPSELFHTHLHILDIPATWMIFCLVVVKNVERPFEALEQAQSAYKDYFDSTPISIWTEDMSSLMRELETLRAQGVTNLDEYLGTNSDEVWRLADQIKIVDVNQQTLQLFKTADASSFLNRIAFAFGDDSIQVFQRELVAIWNQEAMFIARTTFRDSTGAAFPAILSFPIPKSAQEAESVMVNILDVSAEESAREESEKAQAMMSRAALGTVNAIAATIEKRDPYTSGHQEAVAEVAGLIAEELAWDSFRVQGVRFTALIHNIGNVYVPAEILNRPRALGMAEEGIVHSHTTVGAEILSKTELPWPVSKIIEQHHERLDGSGYPEGLKGDEILPEALVIGIADTGLAMTSHRPFRPALTIEDARQEIESQGEIKFGQEITAAALKVFNARWQE